METAVATIPRNVSGEWCRCRLGFKFRRPKKRTQRPVVGSLPHWCLERQCYRYCLAQPSQAASDKIKQHAPSNQATYSASADSSLGIFRTRIEFKWGSKPCCGHRDDGRSRELGNGRCLGVETARIEGGFRVRGSRWHKRKAYFRGTRRSIERRQLAEGQALCDSEKSGFPRLTITIVLGKYDAAACEPLTV